MSLETARKIIDFVFKNTPAEESIDIGFFGGEPLQVFPLLKEVAGLIISHPEYDAERVEMNVVSNGTIFSEEIAEFLSAHAIGLCISCDGPAIVQDQFRCFSNGRGSSEIVDRNLRQARNLFPDLSVNAVYHPVTFRHLPEVVDYFSSIGIKTIHLNPDISAAWSTEDACTLKDAYAQVADRYIRNYLQGNPRFIGLIDAKIIVILRGGYQFYERCRMGRGEFAFAASGNIYPCERLIGRDNGNEHCIGNIHTGLDFSGSKCDSASHEVNTACQECGIRSYCMNWCGCSNYFSTGSYGRTGAFLCASERAALEVSLHAFQTLEQRLGPTFIDHVAGMPVLKSNGVKV